MTHELRWVPDTIEDLQGGHNWYDEREPGLGQQLAAEVFEVLDPAAGRPFLPRKYEHLRLPTEPEIRKIQLRRSDEYGVVYALAKDTFWIEAVAHAKRKPGYWIDRLTKLT